MTGKNDLVKLEVTLVATGGVILKKLSCKFLKNSEENTSAGVTF